MPPAQSRPIGRGKKIAFAALTVGLIIGATEVGLRLAGFRPIPAGRVTPLTEDDRRSYLVEHDQLGYTLRPGSVELQARRDGWTRTFRVTADDHGHRITHAPRGPDGRARDQVWIFGCSMTFGELLNDEESYPWVVQELLPDREVVNFGVGSYSTLHSLIQLEEALEGPERPAVVVLAYNRYHDQRNVVSREWRQVARGRFRRPFARFGADGQLHRGMAEPRVDLLPLADRSVLVAAVDRVLSRIDERRLRAPEVSRVLIGQMHDLCQREGIRFVIANKSGRVEELLAHFHDQGVATVDISFRGRKGLTFAPHDPHPNAAGARYIGERLAGFLRQLDDKRRERTE